MVLLVHSQNKLFMIGEQGVDGFLLMSGWLNAMSLDKSFEKQTIGKAVGSFFVHRAFRILPVYYLLLVIIFVLFWGLDRDERCGQDIFQMIFLYQNFYECGHRCWAVTWSLALEV